MQISTLIIFLQSGNSDYGNTCFDRPIHHSYSNIRQCLSDRIQIYYIGFPSFSPGWLLFVSENSDLSMWGFDKELGDIFGSNNEWRLATRIFFSWYLPSICETYNWNINTICIYQDVIHNPHLTWMFMGTCHLTCSVLHITTLL